jgi:hypothetical protein
MVATTRVSSPMTDLGRIALRADGLICIVAGAIALVDCRGISDFLGVDGAVVLAVIGAGTLLYGAWLAWQTRAAVPRGLVRTIAIANVIWVVASSAMLALGTPAFSTRGIMLIEAVTAVVTLLAAVEFVAYRRAA